METIAIVTLQSPYPAYCNLTGRSCRYFTDFTFVCICFICSLMWLYAIVCRCLNKIKDRYLIRQIALYIYTEGLKWIIPYAIFTLYLLATFLYWHESWSKAWHANTHHSISDLTRLISIGLRNDRDERVAIKVSWEPMEICKGSGRFTFDLVRFIGCHQLSVPDDAPSLLMRE